MSIWNITKFSSHIQSYLFNGTRFFPIQGPVSSVTACFPDIESYVRPQCYFCPNILHVDGFSFRTSSEKSTIKGSQPSNVPVLGLAGSRTQIGSDEPCILVVKHLPFVLQPPGNEKFEPVHKDKQQGSQKVETSPIGFDSTTRTPDVRRLVCSPPRLPNVREVPVHGLYVRRSGFRKIRIDSFSTSCCQRQCITTLIYELLSMFAGRPTGRGSHIGTSIGQQNLTTTVRESSHVRACCVSPTPNLGSSSYEHYRQPPYLHRRRSHRHQTLNCNLLRPLIKIRRLIGSFWLYYNKNTKGFLRR